jgi:DNA primase
VIPESFIQELLGRLDIVDVVERFVPLKKAGANYKACCPFHGEKTPSFNVNPARQFYHCFGCGASGSAIGFVMQYSGLGFIDAVEDLASHAGLQVPHETSLHRVADQARKAPLTELMARAANFYRQQLKASTKAVDYLKARGLTGEVAARFGLGYAPDDWQGLQKAFADYDDAALVECGLIIVNDEGRRYDRFRDRVMFPILDQRSNVIGFGGRVIGDGEPKYLNSPETPLFEKGRELYGLTQARQSIREHDTVIVVEGYMDVVALAQHGIANAVATLGTATTANHTHKLLRQAAKVVFCFDGDSAGRKAAWRALEASLDQLADDKSVGFLFLPPEHDPDSFVRAEGAEAFRRLVAHPVTLSEFLLRQLQADIDLATAEGRARLVHEAKPHLLRLSAPVLRVQVTKAVAAAAALTQAEVEAQCGLKPLTRYRAAPAAQKRTIEVSTLRTLLKAVIDRPGRAARIPLDAIPGAGDEGAALHFIVNAFERGELPTGSHGVMLEFLRGSPHEAIVATFNEAVARDGDEASIETEFEETLENLRYQELESEIAALTATEKRGTLSGDERRRLVELLGEKNRLRSEKSTRV